jgi:hypothetical protein
VHQVFQRIVVSLCLVSLSLGCKSRQFNSNTDAAVDSEATGKLVASETDMLAKYDNAQAVYDDLKEAKKQRILERFLIPMTNIEALILKYGQEKTSEESVEKLAKVFQKARIEFFRFESLVKIYREFDDYKDIFEPIYQKTEATRLSLKGAEYISENGIKEIEDTIGDLAEAEMNLAFSEQVKAPSQIQNRLKIIRNEKYALITPIIQKDWMPDSKLRIPFFVRFFDKLREKKTQKTLLKNKDDREEVVKNFRKLLLKFQETALDYTSLEDGFHELRRNLRWIPMVVVSFDGLIAPTTEKPTNIKVYEDTLNIPELAVGKWIDGLNKFRRPAGKYQISMSLYQSAVYFQEIMGEVKNAWQNFDAIEREYLATSLAKNNTEAEALTIKLLENAGVQRVAYAADTARTLTVKPSEAGDAPAPLPPLMDFPSMGRSIDAIVKDPKTSVFLMLRDQLKEEK